MTENINTLAELLEQAQSSFPNLDFEIDFFSAGRANENADFRLCDRIAERAWHIINSILNISSFSLILFVFFELMSRYGSSNRIKCKPFKLSFPSLFCSRYAGDSGNILLCLCYAKRSIQAKAWNDALFL